MKNLLVLVTLLCTTSVFASTNDTQSFTGKLLNVNRDGINQLEVIGFGVTLVLDSERLTHEQRITTKSCLKKTINLEYLEEEILDNNSNDRIVLARVTDISCN